MSRDVDLSEIDAWKRVLDAAAADAASEGKKIVAKGALNIKTDARRLAPGTGHAKHYPASINYDLTAAGAGNDIIAEIGPAEGRRQRGLGNLLEYGGPHNRPHPHHEPALDLEEPRFYQACEDLAARLVERHG